MLFIILHDTIIQKKLGLVRFFKGFKKNKTSNIMKYYDNLK